MFFLFRPISKFTPGQFVIVHFAGASDSPPRYLLIKQRRWVRPNGEAREQWVYDGPILNIAGRELRFCTNGFGILESSLEAISGLE